MRPDGPADGIGRAGRELVGEESGRQQVARHPDGGETLRPAVLDGPTPLVLIMGLVRATPADTPQQPPTTP